MYLPSSIHDVAVAILHGVFDVHREVIETVDLEGLADAAKEEQYLHIDWLAARTDRSSNGVKETKITSTDIRHAGIAVGNSAVQSLVIEFLLGFIESLCASVRLDPDLTVLSNVCESASLGVHDRNLGVDWHHTRILQQKRSGVGIRVHGVDKTLTEAAQVEP